MNVISKRYSNITLISRNVLNENFVIRSKTKILLNNVREAHNVKALKRVLIANRGEIAVRIMKTTRKLGIETIAVYSDADRHSLHTKLADQSYYIGGSQSNQSYLDKQKIINTAIAANVCAIHPGYGFLSENAEFADMCDKHNIIFIGPKADAIRDMGIKSTSKVIMSNAGVPVVPGYHGDEQNDDYLLEEAIKIGFPVMIKAIRGGGGKGMRTALKESDFKEQLESARREAIKSFGDDSMLIEKFVSNPRHIEVQVFGDSFGNYVHLFERDCSVQRRHQKIIEEAPAPHITPQTRQELGMAAVKAAKAVNYLGAGTVEFIYDTKESKFYFMEMNTRLQVEHPITEMISSTDLVEWQLRVAAGEPLPLKQSDLTINGHSFEARIYAEDPENNFMPGAGQVTQIKTPVPSSDVRIETGVRSGDEVSVHYDPMIAKLVIWGHNRDNALNKLRQCLNEYNIVGLKTNVDFLLRLTNHREFRNGNVYTDFIKDYFNDLFAKTETTNEMLCSAVMALILQEKVSLMNRQNISCEPLSPFNSCDNKRLHEIPIFRYINLVDSQQTSFEIKVKLNVDKTFQLTVGNHIIDNIEADYDLDSNNLIIDLNGIKKKQRVLITDNQISIFSKEGSNSFNLIIPEYLRTQSAESESDCKSILSPMPGIIDKILVSEGQAVKSGDNLLVMIAMKMEYVIKANADVVIDKLLYKPGDNVPKGAQLLSFKQ
ncbi:methylcrotonoyl-CoA carboxylase subunit alpha, mitochondrial-like [Oppia nitens]|uniref:methylcrotonoyl-CoA carboxylase subunit alpha, mitochondrial-like n=1 Tax=Oppia nitens TaxID=1686743 RepID=UPI0023DB1283|nr:methylcrotonoyl-CoA carboxylase subunit alpha, mitochondrial-like [Oppia nitens]